MHPCERKVFVEILSILSNISEVVRFAKFFGGVSQHDISDFTDAQGKRKGFFFYI